MKHMLYSVTVCEAYYPVQRVLYFHYVKIIAVLCIFWVNIFIFSEWFFPRILLANKAAMTAHIDV